MKALKSKEHSLTLAAVTVSKALKTFVFATYWHMYCIEVL